MAAAWETIMPITSTANYPITTMSKNCHRKSKRRPRSTSARFTMCLAAKSTDLAFIDKAAAALTSRYYRRRSIGRKRKSCRASRTCMALVTSERKISALARGVISSLKPLIKTEQSSRIECRRSRKHWICSQSRRSSSPGLNRFLTLIQLTVR